jgi:hypothetical protein
MKYRNGFVSNSSSASFVIKLDSISDRQLEKIKNYVNCGSYKKCNGSDDEKCDGCSKDFYWRDHWTLVVTDTELQADTYMDNFDLVKFCTDVVGVDQSKILDYEGENSIVRGRMGL